MASRLAARPGAASPSRRSRPRPCQTQGVVAPEQLSMSIDTVDGHTVLRFAGEIDIASADRLRNLLESELRGDGRVLVDLSRVTFIDSFGLRVLVSIHGVVDPGSGAFDIVDAS